MTATAPTTAALAATSAATPTAPSAPPTNPSGVLGQNDFLKLMIAQLQHQDPTSPANTNEYLAELAQFTQVEQITNLANANELTGAVQLIGRTVTYNAGSGLPASGTVQSVQSSASGTTVTVEGVPGVKLSSIVEVT
jgi:flagellar basal-body rod modification protein FlgD